MQLYHFYRSSAAYRVRIALHYKKLNCELISINLNNGEQRGEKYREHNKQGRVPTLMDEGIEIGQSSAILEYLDEKYPQPPLMPKDILARAWVRYLSQIIISDMHPVMNNSSVVKYLKDHYALDPTQVTQWFHHWLKQGFDALEANLSRHPDCKNFCWGDHPTIADVCLIPQIYNAFRFDFSMKNYPTLMRIYEHCNSLEYFDKAKPENQMDYIPG
jgi:maleylacetoacetate isomerase